MSGLQDVAGVEVVVVRITVLGVTYRKKGLKALCVKLQFLNRKPSANFKNRI